MLNSEPLDFVMLDKAGKKQKMSGVVMLNYINERSHLAIIKSTQHEVRKGHAVGDVF